MDQTETRALVQEEKLKTGNLRSLEKARKPNQRAGLDIRRGTFFAKPT